MGLVTEGVVNWAMETGRAAAEKEHNTNISRETERTLEKSLGREQDAAKRAELRLKELERIRNEKDFEAYEEILKEKIDAAEKRKQKEERDAERVRLLLREWMESQLAFKHLFFKYGVVPKTEKGKYFWQSDKTSNVEMAKETPAWADSLARERMFEVKDEAEAAAFELIRKLDIGRR